MANKGVDRILKQIDGNSEPFINLPQAKLTKFNGEIVRFRSGVMCGGCVVGNANGHVCFQPNGSSDGDSYDVSSPDYDGKELKGVATLQHFELVDCHVLKAYMRFRRTAILQREQII